MITKTSYSKSNEGASSIAVTFGKEMMDMKGGQEAFMKYFEEVMKDPDCLWLHKSRMEPKMKISRVYIIVGNLLYARGFYGGYEKGEAEINVPGAAGSFSKSEIISWPRMIIAGPLEKCPFTRELRGFRSFRYCEDLW